ncbi:MAG: NADPH2:quinone reductase [Rhodospirillaceae bacterium]|nr:MAG: NADPH2:quinone reductase [Rhodospirillaceae bacterium]
MRAVVCRSLGIAQGLACEEWPSPAVPEGFVRIAVHAAGVNFADTLVMAGRYQDKIEPPFVPGFEVAGVVTEIKATAPPCRIGDRVMAMTRSGGFAEECVARISDVFVLPENMDFIQAAGFPITYGTAHYGLATRARLRSGETLVVHGAAGGAGLTAVACGVLMGATVIATASGTDKCAVAAGQGAHHLIDSRNENVRDRILDLTEGRGADVIYDPVGGALFDASLHAIAPNGRLVVVGFASGQIPQIPANILMVKNVSCIGFNFNAYRTLDPAGVRAAFAELLAWHEAGRLRPHVRRTFTLAKARRAIETLLARGATGKLVLVCRE